MFQDALDVYFGLVNCVGIKSDMLVRTHNDLVFYKNIFFSYFSQIHVKYM